MHLSIVDKSPRWLTVSGSRELVGRLNRFASRLERLSRNLGPDADLSTLRKKLRRAYREVSSGGSSGSLFRVIWAPSDEERVEQNRWKKRLSAIRTHPAAHGFVRGRSCIGACRSHSTYWGATGRGDVSYASIDLEGFFPGIRATQIMEALEAHGISAEDASACVEANTIPVGFQNSLLHDSSAAWMIAQAVSAKIRDSRPFIRIGNLVDSRSLAATPGGADIKECAGRALLGVMAGLDPGLTPHDRILMQGSPAAPAISNLVAKRMDYRLEGLAKARRCHYTRYADDIVFSWKGRRTKREIRLLMWSMARIAVESGFRVNRKKSIVMGPGMPQRLLGYNMNSGRPTVPRSYREDVRRELRDGSRDPLEQARTLGKLAHVATAHPEEAARMLLGAVPAGMGSVMDRDAGMDIPPVEGASPPWEIEEGPERAIELDPAWEDDQDQG